MPLNISSISKKKRNEFSESLKKLTQMQLRTVYQFAIYRLPRNGNEVAGCIADLIYDLSSGEIKRRGLDNHSDFTMDNDEWIMYELLSNLPNDICHLFTSYK